MANIYLNIKTINGQSIVGTGDINTDQDLSSYAPISYVDQSIQALFIPTSTDDLINNSGYITINDIPSIPTKLSQFINDEGFIKLNEVPQTKVDGITIEYNQNDELVVIGGGGGGSGDINVQSDWNESDNTKDEYIKNKPVNVSDFNVDIDLSELTDNTNKLFSGDYDDLNNKPTLFDGDYDSLSNKPNIPQDLSDLTDSTNLLHDTTYSAGSHINIDGSNEISVDKSSLNIPTDLNQLNDSSGLIPTDISDLSDTTNVIPTNNNQLTNGAGYVTTDTTYTAGTNVQISGGNVISATDTTYSDLSEFNNDEGFVDSDDVKEAIHILDLQQENSAITLALNMVGKTLLAGGNITIPTNASVAFEIGTKIEGVAIDEITVGGAGVTIVSQDDMKDIIKYTGFTLIKTAVNTWVLLGGLSE